MKRTGFDEHRDAKVADEYLGAHAACTFCGKHTGKDDLNTYGARCFDCYREYCSQGRYYPPLTRADRAAMARLVREAIGGGLRLPGREHIAQLQRRADSGEAMSPGQRGFLQAVRRAAGGVEDAVIVTREPVQEAPAEQVHATPGHAEPVADDPPRWVLEEIAADPFPATDDAMAGDAW